MNGNSESLGVTLPACKVVATCGGRVGMLRGGRLLFTFLAVLSIVGLPGCGGRPLMATPNLYVLASTTAFADVPQAFRTNTVDVLYVTDRRPVEHDDGSVTYGWDRSASAAFGSCVVEIGKNVSWETLAENSRTHKRSTSLPLSIREITERGRFPDTPPPMVNDGGNLVTDPAAQAQIEKLAASLHEEIRRRLALTPRKEAFIYVHGYNNVFEDSVFVAAEFWHFIERQGVPIAYTWPAGGSGPMAGYDRDRESGEFTIFHLKQFIRFLASCPELEKIHIVAHSRGTDVATSALRELIIEARGAGKNPQQVLKIGNLVLAAPDLDFEVVSQRLAAERIFTGAERITIYVSKYDKALGIADWMFGSARRLGKLRPEDLSEAQKKMLAANHKTDIVDSHMRSGGFEHSYFESNPAVSSDLILVLRDNRAPGAENGRPLVKRMANYWEIHEGYPAKTKD